ncbi:hypothetical protein LTR20_009968 [Exophiala xenobiotica]|nr:hypothetical protein LTS06_011460 [Exophiala xenobiotica]KAK5454730.1 hypothetical protein LTR20_009968 [Exophiala xenobiotica]KAK5516609.1 hypothetical protein LTR21_004295 [Exophiala xenobiotica]
MSLIYLVYLCISNCLFIPLVTSLNTTPTRFGNMTDITSSTASLSSAFTPVASNTTLVSTLTNATSTVAFSSAVRIASSISWQLQQLASIPAIPVPTNVTDIPEYAVVAQLAPAMPPIQAGLDLGDTDGMIADLISWTNISSPGTSLAGRASILKVMVVGDSITQGAQGDWTWRYRLWQWFQTSGISMQFVGPYTGTLPPQPGAAPPPPPLYGAAPVASPPGETGGYATGVSSGFLSNSNHFAVWGRAAAVSQGLIQSMVQQYPTDLMLVLLGFNDLGWFYSDAQGTIDSIGTLIANARASNPNLKFAVANIPQRTFIGGREDLIENTNIYNNLLPTYISQWTSAQSPVYLVSLEQNYSCQPGSCPAGYDGLHPDALGEYQIANAFTQTLVNDLKIGTSPLAVPAQSDPSLARNLPAPSNFKLFSSPQGVTATWDPVYGAYNYDVQVSINGGGPANSPGLVQGNRWDSQWPMAGWSYAVSVRASAGDFIKGAYTATLTATAQPQLAPPPQNIKVTPTADGFTVSWDPPTGPYTDTIVEYNIVYWDWEPNDCQYITGAAFKSSPATITGLTPGVNYLIAPVTWNANGQGLPAIANNAVPGAGTPAVPSNLLVNSNDPTTVHMSWTGSSSAGGYHVWSKHVTDPDTSLTLIANVTGSTCNMEYWLWPGTWNYAFAISAFNGNEESPKGAAVAAPSPASTVTEGSVGPTCAPAQPWCPNGAAVSVPYVNPGSTPTTGAGGSGTSSTTVAAVPTNTNYPIVTNGQCTGPDCINSQCSGE